MVRLGKAQIKHIWSALISDTGHEAGLAGYAVLANSGH